MKIYLIGIGGIAMGNLAYMLKSKGHQISGSDTHLYPPMSDKLKEWGLNTFEGFDASRIKGQDLVIIGNAISRGNPEVEEVLNSGIEYMSMPQAISSFFLIFLSFFLFLIYFRYFAQLVRFQSLNLIVFIRFLIRDCRLFLFLSLQPIVKAK